MTSETEQFLEAKIGAQRRSTWVQVAALCCAASCIAGAAYLQDTINRQRKDLKLVLSSNIYQGLPPKYAWIAAAGGTFRGIAADILWTRAENLKNDGKYYESHQLAKWICTLQPRFPQVWAFQAWNMSYNISVATQTARERWQWVYNGIRLLRDEGIPNNEKSIALYRELAWIWLHKVGRWADDYHWVYKREWAATMETLLGPPPAGLSNAETIDWFRPIAEAPRDLETLIAARPAVHKIVDDLAALGVDVTAGTSIDRVFHPMEEKLFKPFTAFVINRELAPLRSTGENSERNQDDPHARLWDLFKSAPAEDLNALLAHLRAKVLREQYKMDPKFMLELTSEFGTDEPIPIDWRTPWSQGMYWAKYGLEKSAGMKDALEIDALNTQRIMLHALDALCTQGKFTFRINLDLPANSYLVTGPDLRYVEAMHLQYLAAGKKFAEPGEEVGNTAGDSLRSGHVNTLRAAIVNLYFSGKTNEARKYFEYLAINYPGLYTGKPEELYMQGLDGFIRDELKEALGSLDQTVAILGSLLTQSYLSLATGWGDQYTGAVRTAQLFYDDYQKDHSDDRQGRMSLPPFVDIRAKTLGAFVSNQSYPLLYRSLAWNREQLEIRQRCYDLIAADLRQQCDALGIEMAKAFPEPPGMEQFRKENPTLKSQEQVAEEARKRAQEQRQQP